MILKCMVLFLENVYFSFFNCWIGAPDEEEKEETESEQGSKNDIVDMSRAMLEEPLKADRFYLDNGEGTCEIKEYFSK